MADAPILNVKDIPWREIGEADEPGGTTARLLGQINIGGTPFHVEALQIRDDDELDEALQLDDRLEALYAAVDHDGGRYQTTEIDGRPYVLWIVPFQR